LNGIFSDIYVPKYRGFEMDSLSPPIRRVRRCQSDNHNP